MKTTKCPICDGLKKDKNKFCSYACRNIDINSRKDYAVQNVKSTKTKQKVFDDLRIFKDVKCDNCKKEMEVRSSCTGKFKERYWCSRACANSRKWTDADREHKSKASLNSEAVMTANKSRAIFPLHKCETCKSLTRNKRFCSNACKPKSTTPEAYRAAARFQFALNQYPLEFDFDLIRKYGWYQPINRGNNLGGVSRDHLYSVAEGYKNKVDPKLLAHPANCRLVIHNDNIAKNSKSSITLEQLLDRIELWNKKYAPVV